MPRFMLNGTYTQAGISGTISETLTARTKAVKKHVGALGGKLLGMYWSTGSRDSVVIVEFPDASGPVALATTVKAAGAVDFEIVRLMDGAEFDAAQAMAAKKLKYRAPGQ